MMSISELLKRFPPQERLHGAEPIGTSVADGVTHRPEACEANTLYADFSLEQTWPKGNICLTSVPRPECENEQWVYSDDSFRDTVHHISSLIGDFQERGPKLYAVTGTNGKSSVVELTRQLHQQLKPELQPTALGTLGCISSNWTLPSPNTTPFPLDLHPLLREARTKGSQLVVLEASSHALHQERLAHLNISASAIVHLGHDHLDYHKTLNAYHEAKLKLIQMTQGPVVVNIDVLEQYPERFKGCEIITTGINRKADISFEIKEQNEHGFHGQLRLHGHSFTTSLPLWGTFNLSNSLAASAFASISGCDAEAIAEAWPTLQLPKGRLHAVETRAKGDVRIDYAHTPDALESVLLAAKAHCPTARLNVLVGCGGDRDASKRPLMGEIASKLADQLIITSDNPRSESPEGIIQDILLGCGDTKPMVEVDRRKAITKALEAQGENDLLLICGKGHENEQIISDQRHHFDEFEICQKF